MTRSIIYYELGGINPLRYLQFCLREYDRFVYMMTGVLFYFNFFSDDNKNLDYNFKFLVDYK